MVNAKFEEKIQSVRSSIFFRIVPSIFRAALTQRFQSPLSVCTDILLLPQAPAEYQDRATLWNAVEKAERGKKAQLAYSFDIALQNEFSLEENIRRTVPHSG